LLFIQNFIRIGLLDPAVLLYTHLGDNGLIWIVISLVLLCFEPTRRAGVCALGAMLLGLLFTNVLLKNLVQRARPWLVVNGLLPLESPPDPYSFPSGHSCAAFAAAVAWWKTLPTALPRRLGLVMAALMALSRLYVGVHFPSDVLAGALVGTMCALGFCKLLSLRRAEGGREFL